MKKISPKEDPAIFKQQFWHLFAVSRWFNTLTNAEYSKDSSLNGFMCFCAPKKCPLLKHGIKQSELAQWLRKTTRVASELAKQVSWNNVWSTPTPGPPGMKQPGGPIKGTSHAWPLHQK